MEEKKKSDVLFTIVVSKDKMNALLELKKPGIEFTVQELDSIITEIEKQKIIVDFTFQELKEKISLSTGLDSVPIARGKEPEKGIDGYCEVHFNKNKGSKPTILEDGKVDFYNIDFVNNVVKDEVLATIHPPKPGIDGRDVFGNIIPFKPGKDAKIPKGKNIIFQEENQQILSTISGQVSLQDNQINVHETLELKNVDFKTGNIDFVGSVVVSEGVRDGFTVKAQGDVTVNGYVDSSFIICGGNLVVNGGIQGRNKGIVQAGGNVIARYIENCEVKSEGSVVVRDAIMHSRVYAKDKVIAVEGKGLIVGGIIGAGKEINANTIGSHLATQTELEVGVNPELRERLQSLTKELSNQNEDLKKAKQAQRLLKLKEEQQGELPANQKSMLIRLNITIKHLEKTLEKNKETQQEILQELMSSSEGKVKALKQVYSGVKITIGTRYRKVTDVVNSPTFVIGADGEITFA